MNESNFDTLCRLCLRNSFFYMHIYVGQSVDKNPIYEVLNYVYDLEVLVDDGLPEYICRDCLLKLKEFETYKRKAHRVKSELLNLKGNVVDPCVKEENDEEQFRDRQEIDKATFKVTTGEDEVEGENHGPPTEESHNRLEVYIKQEKIDDEEYLPSGGECLEESSQDEVLDSQMCSMLEERKELTTCGTSSISEKKFSYECAMCGVRFTSKHKLKEHIAMHSEIDRFKCRTCGKRFEKYCYLRKHNPVHKEEKLFGCADCGKRFRLKQQLKEHVRIHTGEQPFACEDCGRRFNQKSNLNTHLLIHKDEKAFQCEECGKAFVRLVQLKSHKNTHAAQKGFECPLCKRKFNHLSNLKRHLLIHARNKEIATF